MSVKILHNDSSDDSNYNYFLDLTSQLYYGRTPPDAYRSGSSGFLGGGADTNRSLDCIMANLPPNSRAKSGGAPAPPINRSIDRCQNAREACGRGSDSIAAVAPQM